MEVHVSPIAINSRKQHDNQITNTCSTTYLKRSLQNTQDSNRYQTIRKVVHLESEINCANTMTPVRRKLDSQEIQIQEVKQGVDHRYDYRQSILGPSIRQKYGHLIQPYQSADYNLEQKMLLRMQSSLDQHLQYLKLHRGRKRGEFFKSIHSNLFQGNHIIMDLYHLKQILFIDQQLYVCTREKDKDNNWDVLIDLPQMGKLDERKRRFKEKLYLYLHRNKAFQGPNKNNICVPLYKFDFEEKIEQHNQALTQKQQKQAENLHQLEQVKQKYQKMSLKCFFSKQEKFKENLYERILAKQAKMKELSKINATEVRQFGREEVLKVLDELHLAYTAKKIFNMFRANLIGIISKQLSLHDHVIVQILELICTNAGDYLKEIKHSKGLILQTNGKFYSQARSTLLEMNY